MERSDSQKSHEAWQSPPRFEDAEMIHSGSCSRASGEERQLDGVMDRHGFSSAGRSSARSRQGQKGPCPAAWEGNVGQLGVSWSPGLSCHCFAPGMFPINKW